MEVYEFIFLYFFLRDPTRKKLTICMNVAYGKKLGFY